MLWIACKSDTSGRGGLLVSLLRNSRFLLVDNSETASQVSTESGQWSQAARRSTDAPRTKKAIYFEAGEPPKRSPDPFLHNTQPTKKELIRALTWWTRRRQ